MKFLLRRSWIFALTVVACGDRTELTFEDFGTGGGGHSGGATSGGGSAGYGTGGYVAGSAGYGAYPTTGGSSGYGGYPAGGYTGYGGYPYPTGGYTGYGGYPYPTGGYTGYGGYPYPTGGYTGYGGYPYPTGGYTGYGGYPYPPGGYTGYGGYPVTGGYGGSCYNCPSIYSSDGFFFPACCTATGVCGAMTDELAKILAITPTCAEVLAPGVPDPLCPSLVSVDGRFFEGCCSAATGYCGIDISTYALGCQTVPTASGQYQYCGSDPGVGGATGVGGTVGAGAYAGTGGVPILK